jgi:hypothetical protein
VQLSGLACLAGAATRVDFAAHGRPGVRVIPTNVLHLQEMQEGGALSFRSGCYENNAPSYRPLSFRTLPGDAMKAAWGCAPMEMGTACLGCQYSGCELPLPRGGPGTVEIESSGAHCLTGRVMLQEGAHQAASMPSLSSFAKGVPGGGLLKTT